MATYRQRPIEIDAIQWRGDNWEEIVNEFGNPADVVYDRSSNSLLISTLEGRMRCSYGDWLIRDAMAEYYPCRDDIFRSTYEAVDCPPLAEPLYND